MHEPMTDWGDPLDYNAGAVYELDARPPGVCCGRRMVQARRFRERVAIDRDFWADQPARTAFDDGLECLKCGRFEKGG